MPCWFRSRSSGAPCCTGSDSSVCFPRQPMPLPMPLTHVSARIAPRDRMDRLPSAVKRTPPARIRHVWSHHLATDDHDPYAPMCQFLSFWSEFARDVRSEGNVGKDSRNEGSIFASQG